MPLTGAPPADPLGIEVDLHGLIEFADRFGEQLRTELTPDAHRIIAEHLSGVPFGHRSASTELQAAARQYHACLATAVDALRSYATLAEALIGTARQIAAEYRAADVAAANRVRP